MTHEEFEQAAQYWNRKEQMAMPKEALQQAHFNFAMVNPVVTKKSGGYSTEESCLSLDGAKACTRYQEIEVDYLNGDFKPQHGKYSGFTAQIIQHEIDHCNGVVI